MLEASFVQTKATRSRWETKVRVEAGSTQPLPGTTPALPGSPINLLPPPPLPPLPPMPPDTRKQDCPVNTPCTCYCHCRQPPQAQTSLMFSPPRLPPCQLKGTAAPPPPTTTTTTTTSTTTTLRAVYEPPPPPPPPTEPPPP